MAYRARVVRKRSKRASTEMPAGEAAVAVAATVLVLVLVATAVVVIVGKEYLLFGNNDPPGFPAAGPLSEAAPGYCTEVRVHVYT